MARYGVAADEVSEAQPVQVREIALPDTQLARVRGGLRRRGNLAVWLSDETINSWRAPPNGKPGGQRIYAIFGIGAALTIRTLFHLQLLQTEGFL